MLWQHFFPLLSEPTWPCQSWRSKMGNALRSEGWRWQWCCVLWKYKMKMNLVRLFTHNHYKLHLVRCCDSLDRKHLRGSWHIQKYCLVSLAAPPLVHVETNEQNQNAFKFHYKNNWYWVKADSDTLQVNWSLMPIDQLDLILGVWITFPF